MFAELTPRSTRGLFMSLIIGIIIVTLINCGGGGGGGGTGGGTAGGGSTATPDINSSTTQVAFGNLVKGSLAERTVSVENVGTRTLNIGQIVLGQPGGPFSIPAADDRCSNNALALGGDKCTFRVRFAPTIQNSFSDTLTIPSDDPDENPVRIGLSGTGLDYNVSINQIIPDCNNKEVDLIVSVTDDQNAPVLGLLMSNFSLLENGKSVIATNFFSSITSPISVALALDYSGSSGMFRDQADAGAKEFIKILNFSNDSKDEAAIFKWSEKGEKTQDFTSDINALNNAIDNQHNFAGGTGTALFDALIEIVNAVAARPKERRAVIVMTDGVDEGASGQPLSVNTIAQCIENAKQKGVPIFAIGLGTVSADVLQQIAKGTNGQYFYAPDVNQIQSIHKQIADILTNQYKITYPTGSSGGAVISVDVKVSNGGSRGEDSKDANGC
jgi:VWFA-related protein